MAAYLIKVQIFERNAKRYSSCLILHFEYCTNLFCHRLIRNYLTFNALIEIESFLFDQTKRGDKIFVEDIIS